MIAPNSDSDIDNPFSPMQEKSSKGRIKFKNMRDNNVISHIKNEDSFLPFVEIPITQTDKLLAWIDTGATRSLVNYELLAKYGLHNNIIPTTTVLRGVTDNELDIHGEVKLKIPLADKHLDGRFVVVRELPFERIIGCPEIVNNDIQISIPTKSITMNGIVLQLTDREATEVFSIYSSFY